MAHSIGAERVRDSSPQVILTSAVRSEAIATLAALLADVFLEAKFMVVFLPDAHFLLRTGSLIVDHLFNNPTLAHSLSLRGLPDSKPLLAIFCLLILNC